MLGLKLSISLSQGFYRKIATLEIEFDGLEVKSLVESGSSSECCKNVLDMESLD